MAIITGQVQFTGSLGNISAYRMRGVDKMVLRRKGGPTRKDIHTKPQFENTRRNNQEWKASIMASRDVQHALHDIRLTGDYNYSGALNALCKRIQAGDTVSDWGKRNILFSKEGPQLEGFSLNRYNLFDQVVRQHLHFSVDRSAGTALVAVPALQTGNNLVNPHNKPVYRIVVSMVPLADIIYTGDKGYVYARANNTPMFRSKHTATDWFTVYQGSPAAELQLATDDWDNDPACALLLCAGIEFGTPVSGNQNAAVKYAGAGKILRVV